MLTLITMLFEIKLIKRNFRFILKSLKYKIIKLKLFKKKATRINKPLKIKRINKVKLIEKSKAKLSKEKLENSDLLQGDLIDSKNIQVNSIDKSVTPDLTLNNENKKVKLLNLWRNIKPTVKKIKKVKKKNKLNIKVKDCKNIKKLLIEKIIKNDKAIDKLECKNLEPINYLTKKVNGIKDSIQFTAVVAERNLKRIKKTTKKLKIATLQ